MIALLCMFCISAVCLGYLWLSVPGSWLYHVPVTCVFVLIWLHVLDLRNRRIAGKILRSHPALFSPEERAMLACSPSVFVPRLTERDSWVLTGYDITPVLATVEVTALLYGVICILIGACGPAVLSLGVLLYGLLGPLANAFDTLNESDGESRAVDRYLRHLGRRQGIDRDRLGDLEPVARVHYARVRCKLDAVGSGQDRFGSDSSPSIR